MHSGQSRMKNLEAPEQCPGGWILPWPQESQRPSPCRSGNTLWCFYGFEKKDSPLHSVHSLQEQVGVLIRLSGVKVVKSASNYFVSRQTTFFTSISPASQITISISTQCWYIYINKMSIHCFLTHLRNYLLTGLSTLVA